MNEENSNSNMNHINDDEHKYSKIIINLMVILCLFLISMVGVFAYETYKERILECSVSEPGKVCYTAISGEKKVKLENLPTDKGIKLVVKKKLADGNEVNMGEIEFNTKENITGGDTCIPRMQSSDVPGVVCCEDLELKSDLWENPTYFLKTCCRANECAQDGVCVGNGEKFSAWSKKCENGEWVDWTSVANTCTDSDGGQTYDKMGYTYTSDGNRAFDECNGGTLIEQYCEGSASKKIEYACPNGCGNGACLKVDTSSCEDSDGGNDFFLKGHLSWNVQEFEADEECLDDTRLVEYYCMDNGEYMREIFNCPNGCHDGACLPGGIAIGDMCASDAECALGLDCKLSGRYDDSGLYMESYCCPSNTCASVIPDDPSSHCVGNGGTDQKDTPEGPQVLECYEGKYYLKQIWGVNMASYAGLSCVPGKEYKDDLWNTTPGTYSSIVCCLPSECAQDGVCEPDGADHISTWGVKCDNGVWVDSTGTVSGGGTTAVTKEVCTDISNETNIFGSDTFGAGIISLQNGKFFIRYETTEKHGGFYIYNSDLVKEKDVIYNESETSKTFMMQLKNGNILLAYKKGDANADKGYFKIYDSSGNLVKDEVHYTDVRLYDLSISELDNGNLFVAFRDYYNESKGSFLIMDINGNIIKEPTVISSSKHAYYLKTKVMDNGNIFVVYEYTTSSDQAVKYSIYDSSGNIVKTESLIVEGISQLNNIESFTNGDILVTYRNNLGKREFIIYDQSGSVKVNSTVFSDGMNTIELFRFDDNIVAIGMSTMAELKYYLINSSGDIIEDGVITDGIGMDFSVAMSNTKRFFAISNDFIAGVKKIVYTECK